MVVCGASKASASVRARSCAAAKQRAVQRQCGGECAACERAQPAQAEGNAHLVKVKIWPKRLNEFAGFQTRCTRDTCGFATKRCWAVHEGCHRGGAGGELTITLSPQFECDYDYD
jgi:hypothetical protein